MDNFIIRKAQINDSTTISKLLKQLGYETEPLKIKKAVHNSSNDGNQVYVVSLNEKTIAVMSLIFFDYFPSAQKICRITAIVVDDDFRGLGIGSKLINHAKLIAVNEKCSVLEVTTSLKREKTQKYYEKIGFKKTSYKYIQELNNV